MSSALRTKLAPRLIVAAEDPQIWRTLNRVGASSHEIIRASRESDVREQLAQPAPIAMVIVEPLIGTMSGLKVLDLARQLQPHALRIVASNFADIALLIEGVHNGLVQRILGLPLGDAEVRSLLDRIPGTVGPQAHPLMHASASQPVVAASR
jgi:ActR/RegA family two-component response regulator